MLSYLKRSVTAAAVAAGLLAVGSHVAHSADIQWKMATPWGGGAYLERDVKGFVDRVEALTEGRVKITVYPGGTLGSPLRVTDTVRTGVAQVGHNYMGYDWGNDTTTALFAGHPGDMTPEAYMLWMYKGGGLELWQEYRKEKFGVVSFPCSLLGTEIFLHSSKRVETLEDFRGLRIRTAGAWADLASRLGASTVVMPGGEVYSSLERGVIDAAEWGSPEINRPTGFQNIAQYVIVPGIHQPGGFHECQFNEKAWNRLSATDQELIRMAARLNVFESWMNSSHGDLAAFQELVDGPNEIVQLDNEFVERAIKETVKWEDEQAEKNAWFQKVLESQRAFRNSLRIWSQYRLPIGGVQ